MGPPSCIRSEVDRNVVMRRVAVFINCHLAPNFCSLYVSSVCLTVGYTDHRNVCLPRTAAAPSNAATRGTHPSVTKPD